MRMLILTSMETNNMADSEEILCKLKGFSLIWWNLRKIYVFAQNWNKDFGLFHYLKS